MQRSKPDSSKRVAPNRRKRISSRQSRVSGLFRRPGNRRLPSNATKAAKPKRSGERAVTSASEGGKSSKTSATRGAGMQRLVRGVRMVGKALLGLVLLAGIGIGGRHTYLRIVESDYFHLRTVEVTSTRRSSAPELRRLIGRARGRNLLALDLSAMRRAVEAHPWIQEARFERKLPDTLVVDVTEHRARALLLMGYVYLVNDEGEIFKRANAEESIGLPVITGITRDDYLNHSQAAQERISKGLRALERYFSKIRPELSEVNVNQQGQVTYFLRRGGVALRMGGAATEEKLRRVDAIWAALGPEVRRARVVFLNNADHQDRVTVRMGSYN